MIDIETLSTATNALVLSVGMVLFDENTIFSKVYIKNRISTATGDVSRDTAIWWMSQNDEARKAITETQKGVVEMSEYSLVQELHDILCSHSVKTIWSQGSFDQIIIEGLMLRNGVDKTQLPKYYKWRDLRTVRKILHIDNEVKAKVSHNALDDAVAQVKTLQEICKQYDIKLA